MVSQYTKPRRYFTDDLEPTNGDTVQSSAGTGRVATHSGKAKTDPHPGKANLLSEADQDVQDRGPSVRTSKVKGLVRRRQLKRREEVRERALTLAARTNRLLVDSGGGHVGNLEPDEVHRHTNVIRQPELKAAVGRAEAVKAFDLDLHNFAPYSIDYSRNGRSLLLGGHRGHIAALNWQTKQLTTELTVDQSVHDVKWLHTETMFAVAQSTWTYIYDCQGIELHCIKALDHVVKMEFLPYHFLLATASERGFLSWLDVSTGQMVAQMPTHMDISSQAPNIMAQNPANAVIMLGHTKGTVSMWTPNMEKPVAKMLAHHRPVRGLACTPSGHYLATCGLDKRLKIWDLRQFKCCREETVPDGPTGLAFSARDMLAIGTKSDVRVYKDVVTKAKRDEAKFYPYLRHKMNYFYNTAPVRMAFAPCEDVLGLGHGNGFSSLLVPGCGEPNYDAREVNPYETKKQRREAEVKALLDKVPADLITLDTSLIVSVNEEPVKDAVLESHAKLFIKPKKIDFKPRKRTRPGKTGTAKTFNIRRTVIDERRRRDLRHQLEEAEAKSDAIRHGKVKKAPKQSKSLVDRLL